MIVFRSKLLCSLISILNIYTAKQEEHITNMYKEYLIDQLLQPDKKIYLTRLWTKTDNIHSIFQKLY